jgi:hypothetical protein
MQPIYLYLVRQWQAPKSVRYKTVRSYIFATALVQMAIGAAPAMAQSMFTCKDDAGRVISSDRPIPECSKRTMRELNAYGVVTSEHAAPLNAEQLKQKKVDDENQRVAALKRRQEQSRDKALLIAYPTVASLDSVRELQISDLRSEISVIEKRMVKDHQFLREAQIEAKSPAAGSSFALKKKIEALAASILADNDIVARLRGDIERTRQRFDEDAKRLKQLIREPESSAEVAGSTRSLASR